MLLYYARALRFGHVSQEGDSLPIQTQDDNRHIRDVLQNPKLQQGGSVFERQARCCMVWDSFEFLYPNKGTLLMM
jgi:hypothetical protein